MNLRFSGFLEPFGCGLHDNKLFFIHGVEKYINVLSATVFVPLFFLVEKLVYGNIEHGNEFEK